MGNEWRQLTDYLKMNPRWRKLKAYLVQQDGARHELEGDGVYIELDEQRGILIPFRERTENEGIALISAPLGDVDPNSYRPGEGGLLFSSPVRSSHLVLRCSGANVFYLSAVAETSRAVRSPKGPGQGEPK